MSDLYSLLAGRTDEAFQRYSSAWGLLNHAVYQPLQGILDGTGGDISCKKGCSSCCRRIVVCTRFEALAALEYMHGIHDRSGPSSDAMASSIEKHSRALKEFLQSKEAKESDQAIWFKRNIPCPFLADDACSVYVGRPLSCRIYHSTDDPGECLKPVRRVGQLTILLDAESLFQMIVFKIARRFDESYAVDGLMTIAMDSILQSAVFKKENP